VGTAARLPARLRLHGPIRERHDRPPAALAGIICARQARERTHLDNGGRAQHSSAERAAIPRRTGPLVRMARDELRHLRELSQTVDALEAQIAELVAQAAPQLLTEPGFVR
jgi:hypothetical protein